MTESDTFVGYVKSNFHSNSSYIEYGALNVGPGKTISQQAVVNS